MQVQYSEKVEGVLTPVLQFYLRTWRFCSLLWVVRVVTTRFERNSKGLKYLL